MDAVTIRISHAKLDLNFQVGILWDQNTCEDVPTLLVELVQNYIVNKIIKPKSAELLTFSSNSQSEYLFDS